MGFRHLDVPPQWEHYWTKYPEGHTILEALLSWVGQVDTLTDNINNWNTYLDDFVLTFDTDLRTTVQTTLDEMKADGSLASIMDDLYESVQTDLASKPNIEDVRQTTTISKIELDELSQTVKDAMTGGSVAVVGLNSVGETNLTTGSVTPYKTSFHKLTSRNLIDNRTLKANGFYSPSHGGWSTNTTYKASAAVPVEGGEMVKGNYVSLAVYDVNMASLSGATNTNGTTTLPTGAKFVRFNFNTSNEHPTVFKVTHNGTNQPQPYYEDMGYKDENLSLTAKNISSDFIISERNTTFFKKSRTVNLFDKDKTIVGRYDKLGAYGNETGTRSSDLIPATDGERFRSNTAGHIAFFDANQNFIGGLDPTNYFDIPMGQGIRYFRKAVLTGNEKTEMIVKGDTLPTSYVPYYVYTLDYDAQTNGIVGLSRLNGLKWNTLGDSVTEADWGKITKYDSLISSKYGLTLTNYGDGGTRIAREVGRSDSFVERYLGMRSDADIITVMGGLNDMTSGNPLGNFGDTDDLTFYGALDTLCRGLLDKYVGKSIGFITPTLSTNRTRETHTQYANAIKEVCAHYSIPVLDLTNEGMLNPTIPAVASGLFIDNTHPNDKGQEVIAKRVHSFLESLVY